jgi:hypothetical protein
MRITRCWWIASIAIGKTFGWMMLRWLKLARVETADVVEGVTRLEDRVAPFVYVTKDEQVRVEMTVNKFVGFLETIGKDFAKGLAFAVKYAAPVETLAKLLFPELAPAITAGVDATTLIQNAVLVVEQKFAASGVQTGTGAQKLAEVLLLAEQAVTSLLAQAGIAADTTYVTNLVNAVVALLNIQAAPPTTATA